MVTIWNLVIRKAMRSTEHLKNSKEEAYTCLPFVCVISNIEENYREKEHRSKIEPTYSDKTGPTN